MAGIDPGDGSDDFSPRVDAIDRFERNLDVQVQTLENIDDKASSLIRFLGVLLGVMLAAVRVLPSDGAETLTWVSGTWVLPLAVGVVSLFTSLGLSIVAYLSSEFRYGLRADVAEWMADQDDLTRETYTEIVLRGYRDVLEQNEPIVQANAARFRDSLVALLLGLVALAVSTFFYLVDLGAPAEYLLLLAAAVLGWGLARYIRDQEYLRPDEQSRTDDRP